jgi:uracil-DNA glycosylase
VTDETRPLLIGEAPSRTGDRFHAFPLSGAVAQTLCGLAGIPPQDEGSRYGRWTWALYERFECRNVFARYRSATPWDAARAAETLRQASRELDGRVVVCLGRRPQKALHDALDVGGSGPPDYYVWERISTRQGPDVTMPGGWRHGVLVATVAIPHPSALNRRLHEVDERERSGSALRAALELAVRPGFDVPSPG